MYVKTSSRMDVGECNAWLDRWMPRFIEALGLHEWQLTWRVSASPDEDSGEYPMSVGAICDKSSVYRHGTITFFAWRFDSFARLRTTAIHELVHVLLDDLESYRDGTWDFLPIHAQKALEHVWTQANERTVVRLTALLERLWVAENPVEAKLHVLDSGVLDLPLSERLKLFADGFVDETALEGATNEQAAAAMRVRDAVLEVRELAERVRALPEEDRKAFLGGLRLGGAR